MHRHHYHDRPTHAQTRSSRGTGRRVLLIITACGLAALALYPMTASQRVVAPPRQEPMAKMSPEHLQEHATAHAVVAVAAAGLAELRSQPGYTEPASTMLDDPNRPSDTVRLTQIRSDSPHPTRERALNDALLVAQQRLAERLRAEVPPIHNIPPIWVIRDQFVRSDSIAEVHPTQAIRDEWEAANLNPNRVWVEFDLEVNPDQMRQLRADERRMSAALWFLLAFVAAVAGYGFLRLDAMTKGYLTTGLGIAAAGLVVAAVAALAMIG